MMAKIKKFGIQAPPTPSPPRVPGKKKSQSPSLTDRAIFQSKVQSYRLKKNMNLETANLQNFRRSLLNFKRDHKPDIDQYISPLNYDLVGNLFSDNPKPRDILMPKMNDVSLEDFFPTNTHDKSPSGRHSNILPMKKKGDCSMRIVHPETDLTDTKREYFDTKQKMIYEAKERKIYKRQPGKRKYEDSPRTVDKF